MNETLIGTNMTKKQITSAIRRLKDVLASSKRLRGNLGIVSPDALKSQINSVLQREGASFNVGHQDVDKIDTLRKMILRQKNYEEYCSIQKAVLSNRLFTNPITHKAIARYVWDLHSMNFN